jgi:osmotically inducible protein OsmC
MMLAKLMGDQQKTPKDIQTKATLTLAQRDGGWKITSIALDTEVSGAGLDEATVKRIADQAKEQCPISVLLRPGLESISLNARLKQGG